MLQGGVIQRIEAQVEARVKGKRDAVKLALVGLIAKGHVLIEDVPGVGKTLLAMTLAQSLGCEFRRIQCTSDLLPSDIIGISIYNQKKAEFEFKPGPIFTNILLVDEINRTTPKTQAALLEAMSDRRISVDHHSYELAQPFLVFATQNPVEHQGTYPLPEAQKDRFMLRIRMGYPDLETERAILSNGHLKAKQSAPHVVTAEEILALQARIDEVTIDPTIMDYILLIVSETRTHRDIRLGVSTRGALHLVAAAKAHALLEGRDYLVPHDAVAVAPHVIAHRLILKQHQHFLSSTDSLDGVVAEIMQAIPVPE